MSVGLVILVFVDHLIHQHHKTRQNYLLNGRTFENHFLFNVEGMVFDVVELIIFFFYKLRLDPDQCFKIKLQDMHLW